MARFRLPEGKASVDIKFFVLLCHGVYRFIH